MIKATPTPRIMNSRSVLSRELTDLEIGATLFVPFKYCTANNVKQAVHALRQRGMDFAYDNSGTEYSVITRTL